MRIVHAVVVLFVALIANGQQYPPADATDQFQYTIYQNGTTSSDRYTGIVMDSQGTLYIAGNTEPLNSTTYDLVFLKMTSDFKILNFITFGSSNDDNVYSLALKEADGLIYAAGTSMGSLFAVNTPEISNGILFALNVTNFGIVWSVQFNNTQPSSLSSIALNPSNQTELYAFGLSKNSFPQYGQANQGLEDMWFIKANSKDGSIIWMRLLGSTSSEYAEDVVVDTAGFLYFAGATYGDIVSFNITEMGSRDAIYGKMDSQGNFVWVKALQSDNSDLFHGITVGANNSVYICGETVGNFSRNGTSIPIFRTSYFLRSVVVMETSAVDGSITWVSVVPSDGGSQAESIAYYIEYGSDGRLYVTGSMNGNSFAGVSRERPSYDFDFLFAVYNNNGTSIDYVSILGTSVAEENNGLFVDQNLQVFVIGETEGDMNGTNPGVNTADSVIIKYTPTKDNKKDNNKTGTTVIAAVVACVGVILIVSGMAAFCFIKTKKQDLSLRYEETSPQIPTTPVSNSTRQSTPQQQKTRENTVSNAIEMSQMKESAQSGLGSSVQSGAPRRKGTDNLKNNWMIPYDEIILEKKIGAGAFGEVYKGSWRGIEVAVKQMITDNATSNIAVQDFFAEAELMKKLRPHPNITLLLGVCSYPLCIVTEFVSNGSLHAWLHSNKPMDNDMKISIIRGIAAGMLHLHREGVIHRDLAARNILIDASLMPKVSDFGLSRVVLDNASVGKTQATTGPIKWMAPEALLNKVYNNRTDVWSFGVVIYEVLVRKNPYYDQDAMQVGTKVALGKLSLVDEIQKEDALGAYPEVLLSVMKQCLQHTSNDRPDFQEIISFMDNPNENQ